MDSEQSNKKRRRHSDTTEDDDDEEKTHQTSKCKGATTIPIFLKKTYKMIDTCDSKVACWTADGDMFVVKDPDVFATSIIPQYFDHNKFSSFARQLNFYGFRKMQSKPIRNSDFDSNTAKHVTFYNENFKKGRCDLLKKIQRSTRGGGNNSAQDQQREVQNLKDQVATLETKIGEMTQAFEERMRRLELDMLGRMEQMMLAMAQQQQTQLQLQHGSSVGGSSTATSAFPSMAAAQLPPRGSAQMPPRGTSTGERFEPLPFGARGTSINTLASVANNSLFGSVTGAGSQSAAAAGSGGSTKPPAGAPGPGPTLPPHPKQKALPPTLPPHPKQKNISPTGLPRGMSIPPSRLSSLARGLSRGISNLSRGVSVESNASAVLLRNSWEDKFFSMLMLGENEAAAAAAAQQNAGGGMPFSAAEMQNLLAQNPAAAAALSARALSIGGPQMSRLTSELSSVSNSGIP
ncbi:stress transcription factor A [Seminavis robusta]|uniref:Stress transcription factor A n=1 Tax=Seminavis robusta TaxID=568900 RepID=A0A9N8DLR8_9STRA|nr:stress transcription factor A [Seminavis robusta]|eukprot:Sro229_g093130.1 stress transcription factor A (461) ;mRNA; r:69233-70983